jgi:protein-histidine pros-kinase
MRLQNNFSMTLGISFLMSFVVVAAMLYRGAVRQAEGETMRDARMVLAAATAASTYVSERITPLLTAVSPEGFASESVPSYATQAIMKRFEAGYPEYSYRETALDPTNLNDLPHVWETEIIQRFREDPALTELSGERTERAQQLMYIAQPIRADAGCLPCHGDPKKAPAALLATYGPSHGFGWKQGEVIGATFISVPKSERLAFALSSVFWFLIALGCVLILALMVTVSMVQRAVADPVRRLAEQAERLSVGEHDAAEIVTEGAAEFRSLAGAINRLHRSLSLLLKDVEEARTKARLEP